MEPHREPQDAGAQESQEEEQSDQSRGERAEAGLTCVAQVDGAKPRRQQDRGRRETDPLAKRELGVTAAHEFLKERHNQEEAGPEQGELQRPRAMDTESSEVEGVSAAQR